MEYFLQKINKKYREKNESWQIPEKTKHDDKKDAPPIDITWLIAQEVDSVKAEWARKHSSKPWTKATVTDQWYNSLLTSEIIT